MSVIKLIGSDPNQVSRNRDLGSLAFQDSESAIIESGRIDVKGGGSNLVLWSEEFDNAYWAKSSATVTANTEAAPDGTTTADTLTVSGQYGGINRYVSLQAGATYTLSFWVKANTGSNVYSVQDNDGGAGLIGVFTPTANWIRESFTFTAVAASFTLFIAQDRNASGFGSVYLWGAQLEKSSTLGNYIATTTSAISLENAVGATQLQVLSSSLIDTTYPMAFELASDTELVVKVKGSDGVLRYATLTLA